ncbi:hypothetical protein KDW_28440 [Dictyobacter vulcani]|uniref:Uncharacterized protein n=1 Tax=Dictyobacter vulcani TaxID=2607529 RepID=A0A5J4KNC7_9CHLR|nr:hypothetical protein [Dictyobacter vulcani]GER88682.1 hypothetical protein KDW_28440 [Dictyobacter vulcani]
MNWQGAFRILIRVIFIFAYIAFLAASIRHVATFFHNFEADPNDWVNPYTLAVSIDLTALVLTVGVMFFRGNMPWYAQGFTWVFIVALTAFSWFVNWEYAMTFQGNDLRVNDTLRMLNPILASSFAFLNLAYSVVAEFFSSKNKTAAELAAEVDELELLEAQQVRLAEYRERTKQPSIIQRVKKTAIEAREAVNEVLTAEQIENQQVTVASAAQQLTPAIQPEIVAETPVPAMVATEQPLASQSVAPLTHEEPAAPQFVQPEEPAFVAPVVGEPQTETVQPVNEEVVTSELVERSEDEENLITEPLSLDAYEYTVETRQDSTQLEPLEDFTLSRDHPLSDVFLPAWAGGEDTNTFLTSEEMQPYIPTSDTGSMSRISSATGKLTRRKPMTVPEAAEALALSERRIRELRSQGILVTDESNKIKVASVNAYLGKRKVKTT